MSMKYPSQGNASNDRVEVCFAKKSYSIENALSRGVYFLSVNGEEKVVQKIIKQ